MGSGSDINMTNPDARDTGDGMLQDLAIRAARAETLLAAIHRETMDDGSTMAARLYRIHKLTQPRPE